MFLEQVATELEDSCQEHEPHSKCHCTVDVDILRHQDKDEPSQDSTN